MTFNNAMSAKSWLNGTVVTLKRCGKAEEGKTVTVLIQKQTGLSVDCRCEKGIVTDCERPKSRRSCTEELKVRTTNLCDIPKGASIYDVHRILKFFDPLPPSVCKIDSTICPQIWCNF